MEGRSVQWLSLDGAGATASSSVQASTVRELKEQIARHRSLPLIPLRPMSTTTRSCRACACASAVRIPEWAWTPRGEVPQDSSCALCRLPNGEAPCARCGDGPPCAVARGACKCGFFHAHCLETWFESRKALSCPSCTAAWSPVAPSDAGELPLPGESTAGTAAAGVEVWLARNGGDACIRLQLSADTVTTPAALRKLVHQQADPSAVAEFDGLILRRLGHGLLLQPDAVFRVAAGEKFTLCGADSHCARFDVNVKVSLPKKTVQMDVSSHDSLNKVCRELQRREGIDPGKVALFSLAAGSLATEALPRRMLVGSLVGGSRGFSCETASVVLKAQVDGGRPPFVDLDFFGPHGRRLPSADGGMRLADGWPSVCAERGDTVYVVVRACFVADEEEPHRHSEDRELGPSVNVGLESLFALSADWMPGLSPQTEEGLRHLVAYLHVLCSHCTTDEMFKIVASFRSLVPSFPPAADALRLVLGKRTQQVSRAEKAALASGVVQAIRCLVETGSVEESKLLEQGMRVLFFWCLREGLRDGGRLDEGWRQISILEVPDCAEAMAAYGSDGCLLCRDGACASGSGSGSSPGGLARQPWQMLVRQSQQSSCFSDFEGTARRWAGLLRVLSPLSLGRAPKPSLTRDEDGHICVFTGTGKDVQRSTQLYLPSRGQEITVDVHSLAQKLERAGGVSEAAADEVARPTQEAVLVLLDTSNSMNGNSGFQRDRRDGVVEELQRRRLEGWDEDEPEDDSSAKVQRIVDEFKAKQWLKDLRRMCRARVESMGFVSAMLSFASEAMLEGAARDVLQELCRFERVKPTADPDVCRIYTKHQAKFITILCRDPNEVKKPLTGTWTLQVAVTQQAVDKRRKRKKTMPAASCLPSGSYSVELYEVAKAVTGTTGEWALQGTVDDDRIVNFVLSKEGQRVASCRGTVDKDGDQIIEGSWSGTDGARGMLTLARRTAGGEGTDTEVLAASPSEFLCPITHELMKDPVTCADGHSYEREALVHWVQQLGNETSPLTGQRFAGLSRSIVANHALRKQIASWRAAHPSADAAQADGSHSASGSSAAAAAASPPLQIFCKTLTGRTITLNVTEHSPAAEVMSQIAQKTGVPENCQRLIYAGRQLEPHKTMADYGIGDLATLHLVVRLGSEHSGVTAHPGGGGGLKPVLIQVKNGASTLLSFLAHQGDTIETVMMRLWCGVPQHSRAAYTPSTTTLWRGLTSSGDGYSAGTPFEHKNLSTRVGNLPTKPVVAGDTPSAFFAGELELTATDRYVPRSERPDLSRIECVKRLFDAFVNRSQAYDYANEMGLVLFGSTAQTTCEISPIFEDFRDCVDEAQPNGDTCLFDALDHAVDELERWKEKGTDTLPGDVALRILVLSDGRDTCSKNSAWQVARRLQSSSITLDVIMIGDERDRDLHAIAKSTGGYVFNPVTLANALKLCELEVLLSSSERPPKLPLMQVNSAAALRHFMTHDIDMCTEDKVPQCRAMPLLTLPVRELGATDLSEPTAEEPARNSTAAAPAADAGNAAPLPLPDEVLAPPRTAAAEQLQNRARQRRVLIELRQFMNHGHPAVEVFPSDDLSFWKLLLEGPEGTPYHGGVWVLYCHLPSEYPEVAPRIRFVTPIRHCNVNAHGRICHSILDRNYTADTTVLSIMHCIYGLMLNPDYDDPLDSTLALEFYEASGTYEDSIRRHVQTYAGGRSREAVRQSLLSGKEEHGPHSAPRKQPEVHPDAHSPLDEDSEEDEEAGSHDPDEDDEDAEESDEEVPS